MAYTRHDKDEIPVTLIDDSTGERIKGTAFYFASFGRWIATSDDLPDGVGLITKPKKNQHIRYRSRK